MVTLFKRYVHLEPQNMKVFGIRVFADVIKERISM